VDKQVILKRLKTLKFSTLSTKRPLIHGKAHLYLLNKQDEKETIRNLLLINLPNSSIFQYNG